MELTELSTLTAEHIQALQDASITTVQQLKHASDETLLKLMSGRALKKLRIALESVVDDAPYAKFEWPETPNGHMLLWRDEPNDRWARFIAGFYITNDPDEIAILRHRASKRGDIFEVGLDDDLPQHAQPERAVPQADEVDMSAVDMSKYLKGE